MAAAGPAYGPAPVDPVTGRVLETPELRAAGLAELRTRMAAAVAAGEFTPVRDDDQFLLAFLRCKKYDMVKALATVKNFCEFWHGSPAVVEGLCAAKCRRLYDLDLVRFLPGTDKLGNSLGLVSACHACMDGVGDVGDVGQWRRRVGVGRPRPCGVHAPTPPRLTPPRPAPSDARQRASSCRSIWAPRITASSRPRTWRACRCTRWDGCWTTRSSS